MIVYGVEYIVLETLNPPGAKGGHEKTVCECGMTIRSCRCMGPHVTKIVQCTHGRIPVMGPNATPGAVPGFLPKTMLTKETIGDALLQAATEPVPATHEAITTTPVHVCTSFSRHDGKCPQCGKRRGEAGCIAGPSEDVPNTHAAITGVVQPAEKPVRPEDQQLPQVNDLPSMHDQAIQDLQARKELGARRYGVALQPSNGRDAIRDAYEEALDGAAYGAQAVWEQAHPEATYVGDLIESLAWLFDRGLLNPVLQTIDFGTKFVPPAVVTLLESHGFTVSRTEKE